MNNTGYNHLNKIIFLVGMIIFLVGIITVSPLKAQTCVDVIPASTPLTDFEVHNNGTVTHTPTGLMWKVCSEGQTWQPDGSCTGNVSTHTWQQALQIAYIENAGTGFAGHNDWRLPNIKELGSIVEFNCFAPAINSLVFNNTSPLIYWSSSPTTTPGTTWAIHFHDGDENHDPLRTKSYHVRLVRNAK